MTTPYHIHLPKTQRIPILLSVPHCGIEIPSEIRDTFQPEILTNMDDTDWFVDKLYDFAPTIGITMITARYSRWVIDLNRSPDSTPLYTDGRVITDLVPLTNFLGESLYKDSIPDSNEIQRRIQLYYQPYHQKIEELLTDLQQEFGKVLLYDAHSIRQSVPNIQKDAFPDLILGDNDGAAAHPLLIETALECLEGSFFEVSHNHPFKGGYITRYFGKPQQNRHALQLERVKTLYMDDTETKYDTQRADKLRKILQHTLLNLGEALGELT